MPCSSIIAEMGGVSVWASDLEGRLGGRMVVHGRRPGRGRQRGRAYLTVRVARGVLWIAIVAFIIGVVVWLAVGDCPCAVSHLGHICLPLSFLLSCARFDQLL